jgi:hypothetical protein
MIRPQHPLKRDVDALERENQELRRVMVDRLQEADLDWLTQWLGYETYGSIRTHVKALYTEGVLQAETSKGYVTACRSSWLLSLIRLSSR